MKVYGFRFGDHAPSRSPFQILIALCATPRLLFLALQWLVHRYPPSAASRADTANESSGSDEGQKGDDVIASTEKLLDAVTSTANQAVGETFDGSRSRVANAALFVGISRTLCWSVWYSRLLLLRFFPNKVRKRD